MAKKVKKSEHMHTLSLWEIFKRFLESKLPVIKTSATSNKNTPPKQPDGVSVNHVAIVLDGNVEETIRVQNRLLALLLSNPTFVEYSPSVVDVKVGDTKYIDGRFINPELPPLEVPIQKED